MPKALIVIGDASETLDTLYPYDRLQEAGIEPVVIAPEKRTYHDNGHFLAPWIKMLEDTSAPQIPQPCPSLFPRFPQVSRRLRKTHLATSSKCPPIPHVPSSKAVFQHS